jgi:proteasome lid subunit RPN8/RPN11
MNQETVEIAAEHYATLRHAIESSYPHECCGVLLGRSEGARLIVQRVVRTLNPMSTKGSFAISDHEMRRVRVLAAEAELHILAVFHSHPSGSTELSSRDRASLEYSEWPWVIITQDPKTREVLFTWYKNQGIDTGAKDEVEVGTTMAKELQQANLFELSGDGIQVTYSTSGLEGLPLFSYRNGNINRQFSGAEIRSVATEIGELLTITVEQILDIRTVNFTLILPTVNVLPGSTGTHIQVFGIITTTHMNIPGPVLGPAKTYYQGNLNGTARLVSF